MRPEVERLPVRFGARKLPVLREAEIVVVGGSLAGIAAASALARAGRKVVVVEPRTYLGREITATLRPWITPGQYPMVGLMEALLERARVKVAEVGSDEIPLHMDRVKLFLEDVLLQAGIGLIYASLPICIVREGERIRGIVIANKSGRQVITCSVVMDATETAVAARVAGVPFEPDLPGASIWCRTLEFDQVKPLGASVLEVPGELGVVGNTVRLRPGYVAGDILVECAYELAAEQTGLGGQNAREIEARQRSIHLAAHLVHHVPEFQHARLGTASNELLGSYATSMSGPAPAWTEAQTVVLPMDRGPGETVQLPVAAFVSPLAGLWCLNEAARLPPAHRGLFQNPVTAAMLGEGLAQALQAHWAEASTGAGSSLAGLDAAGEISGSAVEVREQECPQRGRSYPRLWVSAQDVPLWGRAEVLVAGGGTSGATAARIAAQEGARTVLVELNPGLGGTATYGGVDAYWAGRHVAFAAEVKRRVNEIHATLRLPPKNQWNHQAKMQALLGLAQEAGVELLFNVITIAALVEQNRVRGVVVATRWGPLAVTAERVVDATGDGDVAAFAGAPHVYGSVRDHSVMWFSLNQQKRPGRTQGNFTSMVDVSNIEDYTRAILVGRRRGGELYDHGIYVATRESRHIAGDATVNLTDILLQRAWPDVINVHFSNYDIKGKSEADWELLGIVPPNLDVEIPYGALLPKGLESILVAGKAFSGTHDALPGIRMQADLENLGGAAGLAAALSLQAGVTPRALEVRGLQQRLVDGGLLPPDVLSRTLVPREYTDVELRALIEAIDPARPLHAYSDQKLTEVFRGIIPEVELGTAGPRAVALLERAHAQATGARKIRLAQILCVLGSHAGVPTLVARIEEALRAREELPPRESFIRNSNLPPPDQAAMPDMVYLIYSLGMARDRRSLPVLQQVAELLNFTEEDLWDYYASPFLYVDAIASVAERLGDPGAVPILERVHAQPLLNNLVNRRGVQPNFILERLAMLELAIARALARCGSPHGYVVLIHYLNDGRALLAEQSHTELSSLTGEDFGKDVRAWSDWLEAHVDELEPQPMLGRLDMPGEDEVILRPTGFMERLRTPYRIESHPDFGRAMVPQYD